MWAKILLLAVNIKPQKLNVGKIFKYGAKNVREILNLQIQFFPVKGLLIYDSLKNVDLQWNIQWKKLTCFLHLSVLNLWCLYPEAHKIPLLPKIRQPL